MNYNSAKILVVDDNYEIRENLVEILNLKNYTVLDSPDGRKAIEMAMSELPDLILCDIGMNGFNGFEVLLEIKNNSQTENIPLIFLTGCTDEFFKYRAIELGASYFITKPFVADNLLSIVHAHLVESFARRKKTDEVRCDYADELQQALHLTSHGVRKPICNYLGLINLLNTINTPINEAELRTILNYMKGSALELDQFTKDLTDYLSLLYLKYNKQIRN